jgi:hypothetical protein
MTDTVVATRGPNVPTSPVHATTGNSSAPTQSPRLHRIEVLAAPRAAGQQQNPPDNQPPALPPSSGDSTGQPSLPPTGNSAGSQRLAREPSEKYVLPKLPPNENELVLDTSERPTFLDKLRNEAHGAAAADPASIPTYAAPPPQPIPRRSPNSSPTPMLTPFEEWPRADCIDGCVEESYEASCVTGCCASAFARPLWGTFRVATHAIGFAGTCFTFLSCGACSLGCRAFSRCSNNAKSYADQISSYSWKNLEFALVSFDSIKNRMKSALRCIWKPVGSAVGSDKCANSLDQCSLKTDRYLAKECHPKFAYEQFSVSDTHDYLMNTRWTNCLKWMTGAEAFNKRLFELNNPPV